VTGFPGHAAYTASKHGVIGLTKAAAIEYAQLGIRVNAICPAYTRTPMLDRMLQQKPDLEAKLIFRVPLRRLCTTAEIAQAAIYLFSDAAAFITGHSLVLDGGIMAEYARTDMSLLFMVRHGQASFHADDYDQLSTLGVEQARLLGVHWAELKLRFDHVYVGPRRRHAQTMEAVAAVYRERGLKWPKPVKLPELDEHSGLDVLLRSLPDLIQRDPAIREMKEKWRKDSDTAQRDFLRLYQKVMRMWVRRELRVPDLEAWHEFRDRVSRGFTKITHGAGSKKRVVAFSSAGPVAAAMGLALNLDDEKTFDLSWAVRNAAYTEFLFSRGRLSLLAFNGVAHLTNPQLLTFI